LWQARVARSLLQLWPHVFFVALRADPVAERRAGALFDVTFERAIAPGLVADTLAIRADGQEALELVQRLAQPENALRHAEARGDLLAVHGLGEEVVDARVHRGEEALAAAPPREQDEIRVACAAPSANPPAQLEPVQLWHLPIGDDHALLGEQPGVPSIAAVRGDRCLVAADLERGREQFGGDRLVFGDEDVQGSLACNARSASCRRASSVSSRRSPSLASLRSPLRPAVSRAPAASVAAGAARLLSAPLSLCAVRARAAASAAVTARRIPSSHPGAFER